MKTFNCEMIEALDTEKPIGFADEHGDYVLLAEAQAIIDALEAELDALRKQLEQVSDKPVSEREAFEVVFKRDDHHYTRILYLWEGWQARAALNQPAKACEYCDDTGDVHSIDGEWRGECTVCDANKAKAAQQVESDSKNA